MIIPVDKTVWQCTICDWYWIAHEHGERPKRCPRRTCRRLAGYKGPSAAVIAEVEKIQKSIKDVESRLKLPSGMPEVPKGAIRAKNSEKPEKQLSKSEQLRKTREANYGRR
jgi:hypothetical protein